MRRLLRLGLKLSLLHLKDVNSSSVNAGVKMHQLARVKAQCKA